MLILFWFLICFYLGFMCGLLLVLFVFDCASSWRPVWVLFGVYVGSMWVRFGFDSGSIGVIYLGFIWYLFGFLFGLYVGFIWVLCVFGVGIIWRLCVFYLGSI